MSALYMLSGAMSGTAITAVSMGADGRFAALMIPSIVLALIGASIEHARV